MNSTLFDPLLWGLLVGAMGGVVACFFGWGLTRRMTQNDAIKSLSKKLTVQTKAINDLRRLVRDVSSERNSLYRTHMDVRAGATMTLRVALHYLRTLRPMFGDHSRPQVIAELESTLNLLEHALPPETAVPTEPAKEEPNGQEPAPAQE